MLTLTGFVKSALSPGRIALGIAKVRSCGSLLTLRIFIRRILPYVIVGFLLLSGLTHVS